MRQTLCFDFFKLISLAKRNNHFSARPLANTTMKRKSQTEEGTSNMAKSQRREEERGHCDIMETMPWDVQAGMILEVNLRNFMCHEVMALD